jgi:phage tail-like protein
MRRTEIEELLPEVFRRTIREGDPLRALLGVMEEMHAPSEAAYESVDNVFNPYRCPDEFVINLARWVDLARILGGEEGAGGRRGEPISTRRGNLRELIATAFYLSQWRGTQRGLVRFLETATGITGFQIDESVPGSEGQLRTFFFRVTAPPEAAIHETLIRGIVGADKPAYVSFELVFKAPNPG